jgi:hypothetical protein
MLLSPAILGLMIFGAVGCGAGGGGGGRGGGGTGSNSNTPANTNSTRPGGSIGTNSNTNMNTPAGSVTPPQPTLFVFDAFNGAFAFPNPATANGNVTPTIHFWGRPDGSDDAPSFLHGAAVDRSGALLFLENGLRLDVFSNALPADPFPQPDATIASSDLVDTGVAAMTYDRPNDRLFIISQDIGSDVLPARVLVYDNITRAPRVGNVAANRIIASTDLNFTMVRGTALGPNGDLYIVRPGSPSMPDDSVVVYTNAATRNGQTRVDRIITVSVGPDPGDFAEIDNIFIDGSDRLYVLDNNAGFVHVLEGAATLNGANSPVRSIDFDFLPDDPRFKNFGPLSLTIDSRGTGYILADIRADLHAAILVLDNIATRSGTIVPDRIIEGPDVGFEFANGLYLWE